MATVFEAFMLNGDFSWIKLDRTIISLDQDKINMDESKLKTRLDKEVRSDSSVIGIIDGSVCLIKLHDDFRFTGTVWVSQTRLSGRYTPV